jgi:predicted DNA-binding protein with PD1-like motif
MQFQRFDHRYQLRFMAGERAVATLIEFCRAEGIGYAALSGLGAVSDVDLAYFNDETQKYETHKITEQLEVIGLTGNITIKDGAPFAHVHATFGDRTWACVAATSWR